MQRCFFAPRMATAASSLTHAASLLVAGQRTTVTGFTGSHEEFVAKVAKGATIVDFYTDWCGPCKAIAPQFAQLSDKYPAVTFLKINVEENEDIGAMMNVRSIPYFVLFDDGKTAGAVEGSNLAKLTELIEAAAKPKN